MEAETSFKSDSRPVYRGYGRRAALRILLVKPHPSLLAAKRLMDFLHLEPLELEIVAGGVPEEDRVAICDLTLEKEPVGYFRNLVREQDPHIVGFTGYSNQANRVRELAEIVKQHNPATLVVVGGIHATIVPADLVHKAIDLIVRGEGGTAFREVLRRYKAGESLSFDGRALTRHDPDFHERADERPPPFPEVDAIPKPRRDLVRRSAYFSAWTASDEKRLPTMYPQIASVRTSYGCKFNCSFCVVHHIMNRKYLERSPEDVVDELAALEEDYVYFVDDETFLSPRRMETIARLLLERGVKKKYVSWARADTICRHPDLFRLWKRAGLSIVYVGLEAMDEQRLKDYGKKTSVDTNARAVATLREIGLTLHASLMVDPGFTVEDFRRLERTVKSLSPAECSFTVFSPSPGTDLWHQHRNEFICDPYLYYDCMHTILPTRLPLNKFYDHFSYLYRKAWAENPLRVNKVKVPIREIIRSIVNGTRYVVALRTIYRNYPNRP